MRRLYSTFAYGWPGAGLLLMRLVTGVALVDHGPQIEPFFLHIVAFLAGLLLLAGLWTPIAGGVVAVIEFWVASHELAFPPSADLWAHVFVAFIGVALALLGPGGWSVDARLFGWKRIEIRDRKSSS